MTSVAIRIPDEGETPLSLAEQRLADEHGIACIRNRQPQFAWRTGIPKPQRPARGKTYELRQMLRDAPRPAPARAYRTDQKGFA